jgi:hypothetical protein
MRGVAAAKDWTAAQLQAAQAAIQAGNAGAQGE